MSVTLHHTEFGGAVKPPLLLLHGLLGSARNWQTAGKDLAGSTGSPQGGGYQVFALDARNHGKSPHAAEMDYALMVADVIAWMDRTGLARATVVGHSMGGKTAMLLACRHPERVERLVVVDIAPKDYFWIAHRAEFAAMNGLELSGLRSRAEAEMRFEALVPSLGMRKFLTTNLERDDHGRWRWTVNLPVLTAALTKLESNSLANGDRFAGPVQFIAGGQSPYVQPEDHAVIRKHFPTARIEGIAEAGHNPHMETREDFVRTVLGATAVA
jgi:esterase